MSYACCSCFGSQRRLVAAALKGDVARVRAALAAGADPDGPDARTGWPPLFFAASCGRVEAMRALLAGGADVNATDAKQGQTALHVCAYFGRAEASHVLLAAGAAPGTADSDGDTPLHSLCRGWRQDELFT